MDSDLLDLPLGVKIHVKPKSKTVFCRGKLGETLNGPCPYFNLDDPYIHHPAPPVQYNRLHDPHLRDYHKRKDILRMLKRQGVITRDNKVVCTLKEFNEYRNYLTRLKLQLEKILRQQEEGLLPLQEKLKDGPKLAGPTDTSCQGMQQPQPQKPSCPCPQKSKETPLKSGRFRRVKIASDKGQTCSRAELGTAADSQRKPHKAAHGLFKAVLRQLTAAEAQKLQELVEAVVHEVFGRLRVPRDYYVNFLRRAARKIRGIVFSSRVKTETPLDHRQEMEMLAKELVATVLESLGDHLEPKASEPRRAARWNEQPVDGRATLVDKSKEAEAASSDIARLDTCLDKLTRQVVKNVRCLLKSMVASQFEGDSSCEYTKIPEFPKDKVSNRQMQPGISGACEGQSQEASTGVKLPALGPQLQEEGNGYAKTMEPENAAMLKEMVREMNPATSGNTLDIRTTANRIVQSLLDQIGQHGPAPTPRQKFQVPVPSPATSQGGEESCAAEDTLPSVNPQFSRQLVPLEGPQPPAQTGARRRSVNPQLV